MGFGKKLKVLLKNNGLSQRKYAEAIEENETQLSKVITEERSPSFEMLQKTVNYFKDVDLNWWLRDEYQNVVIVPKASEAAPKYSTEIIEEILKMEQILNNLKEKVSQ